MIGISQERANVFRAPAKRDRVPGKYAAGRGSAFVKFFYFYIYDADWGPSFIRFCTYAPFGIRVWPSTDSAHALPTPTSRRGDCIELQHLAVARAPSDEDHQV